MAFLSKKGSRYYICESVKKPKVDKQGIPLKSAKGKPLFDYAVKWKPSSKIKKLAEIELAKYEEDKDRGRIGLDRTDVSWSEIKKRYLDYSKAAKSTASLTLDKYVFDEIERYAPSISSVKDLTISFAESFFAWCKQEKNNSDATIRRKGTTIKNIGAKLVDWDIVKYNPLQKLKIKNVRNEKEIKFWKNPKDAEIIITNSTGVWKTINILGFSIGVRISEALNSDWQFVDFENHTIKIQSTGSFRTKSRRFRVLKMPPYLEAYLKELKQAQAKNKRITNTKIVCYDNGATPTMLVASQYLKKFYKAQGYAGFHSHCLRHSFAAKYLLDNKDIYGLSKILGHHSVTITERYYGHLVENYYDKTLAQFQPF